MAHRTAITALNFDVFGTLHEGIPCHVLCVLCGTKEQPLNICHVPVYRPQCVDFIMSVLFKYINYFHKGNTMFMMIVIQALFPIASRACNLFSS